jgi:hypothetical protein
VETGAGKGVETGAGKGVETGVGEGVETGLTFTWTTADVLVETTLVAETVSTVAVCTLGAL